MRHDQQQLRSRRDLSLHFALTRLPAVRDALSPSRHFALCFYNLSCSFTCVILTPFARLFEYLSDLRYVLHKNADAYLQSYMKSVFFSPGNEIYSVLYLYMFHTFSADMPKYICTVETLCLSFSGFDYCCFTSEAC